MELARKEEQFIGVIVESLHEYILKERVQEIVSFESTSYEMLKTACNKDFEE